MSPMKYVRLSLEDREEISRLLASKLSFRRIAEELGRSPSTISREIRRFSRLRKYRAVGAQRNAIKKAKSKKQKAK